MDEINRCGSTINAVFWRNYSIQTSCCTTTTPSMWKMRSWEFCMWDFCVLKRSEHYVHSCLRHCRWSSTEKKSCRRLLLHHLLMRTPWNFVFLGRSIRIVKVLLVQLPTYLTVLFTPDDDTFQCPETDAKIISTISPHALQVNLIIMIESSKQVGVGYLNSLRIGIGCGSWVRQFEFSISFKLC